MDDSDLVEGLRRQDPEAVQHLSECYLPSVWRFVYAKVNRDEHLAEDLVSEAILALIKAVADPELEIRNVGGWLRTVASNKVMDHFRSASRVQHLIDEVQKTAPMCDDNDAAKQQELEDRRGEVRDVMDDLPEQTRMALEWKYVEKLSVREIARRLGTTEKATESILFRGRKDFRERILRRDGQDDAAPAVSGSGNSNSTGNNGKAVSGQERLQGSAGKDKRENGKAETESPEKDSSKSKADTGSLEAAKVGRS